jgi:integrase-like protein
MGQAADSLRDSSNVSNAPCLIDRFRAAIRSRQYSRRTEKTYWFWIRWL